MEKFLFTDGVNGVKELQSAEALHQAIAASPHPGKIRIWVFNSHEWISYESFQKNYPLVFKKETPFSTGQSEKFPVVRRSTGPWLKKILIGSASAAGVFLIFDFTKIKWTKAAPVNISAARPANVPLMDIDSLINEIEYNRGVILDKSTRTNLRIRNTWPDRVELKLHADRETGNGLSRYERINLSIDNTTGFNIDEATVKLRIWKNGKVNASDTVKFNNIRYDKVLSRLLNNVYRGDSIDVSFESIRSKSFNFCYSAALKNNSGNYNDRWFCRE